MPLYQTLSHKDIVKITLWQINETEEELKEQVHLFPADLERMDKIKHPVKIREFLALRCCLKQHFGENLPVFYTPEGKPYLKNGNHISFSHTHDFAGIVVSSGNEVGIDLEAHRDGIQRIAPKFLRPEEKLSSDPAHHTGHITFYWGAKEVMVKIEGNRRLNFKNQLQVKPFDYQDKTSTEAFFEGSASKGHYRLYFEKLENLYLTYGWKVK